MLPGDRCGCLKRQVVFSIRRFTCASFLGKGGDDWYFYLNERSLLNMWIKCIWDLLCAGSSLWNLFQFRIQITLNIKQLSFESKLFFLNFGWLCFSDIIHYFGSILSSYSRNLLSKVLWCSVYSKIRRNLMPTYFYLSKDYSVSYKRNKWAAYLNFIVEALK